jgi:hypothetical protein
VTGAARRCPGGPATRSRPAHRRHLPPATTARRARFGFSPTGRRRPAPACAPQSGAAAQTSPCACGRRRGLVLAHTARRGGAACAGVCRPVGPLYGRSNHGMACTAGQTGARGGVSSRGAAGVTRHGGRGAAQGLGRRARLVRRLTRGPRMPPRASHPRRSRRGAAPPGATAAGPDQRQPPSRDVYSQAGAGSLMARPGRRNGCHGSAPAGRRPGDMSNGCPKWRLGETATVKRAVVLACA